MSTNRSPLAPIAVTSSRLLTQQLLLCADDAGCTIELTKALPDVRRHIRRRPIVLVGFDVVRKVRTPIISPGLTVVAGLEPADTGLFAHAQRLGIPYVIALPAARPWLAQQLLHPPVH